VSPFRDRQRVRNVLGVVVGVAAVLLAAGVVYLIVTIRSAQISNTDVLAETHANTSAIRELAQQIDSCVDQTRDDGDPVGDCAKQGQQSTKEAVVGINSGTLKVVVAALSCQADGIVDRKELARCTVRRSETLEEAAQ
jgi:hypothetical protein